MDLKPPLSAPRAMKIIRKMTRNEEYMNKCSIIDLCSVMGMSTLWNMDRIPIQSKIILCDFILF